MIGELRADADPSPVRRVAGEHDAGLLEDGRGHAAKFDRLADVMGERHRIIGNDWLAAHMQSLIGHPAGPLADMLSTSTSPRPPLHADLAGPRLAPRRLYAAAEVLSALRTCAANPPSWCTTTSDAGAPPGSAPSSFHGR